MSSSVSDIAHVYPTTSPLVTFIFSVRDELSPKLKQGKVNATVPQDL